MTGLGESPKERGKGIRKDEEIEQEMRGNRGGKGKGVERMKASIAKFCVRCCV